MSLRAFIQHNFWLKLFSLLLATLIWFAINFGIERIENELQLPQNPITNPATKENLNIPVRVLTRPGDPRIFKVEPEEVIVSITGEAAILKNVSSKTIAVFVDLTNVRSQRETNQQVRLDIPVGVTVINVSPRAVNVEEEISPE